MLYNDSLKNFDIPTDCCEWAAQDKLNWHVPSIKKQFIMKKRESVKLEESAVRAKPEAITLTCSTCS